MVDPALADIYGAGPQVGSPYIKIDDMEWAISSYTIIPGIFNDGRDIKGFGVMRRTPVLGLALWNFGAEPYVLYETIAPNPAVDPGRTLSIQIANHGGPVPFIIDFMAFAMKQISNHYGTTQGIQWTPGQSETAAQQALESWQFRVFVPNPMLILLQAK